MMRYFRLCYRICQVQNKPLDYRRGNDSKKLWTVHWFKWTWNMSFFAKTKIIFDDVSTSTRSWLFLLCMVRVQHKRLVLIVRNKFSSLADVSLSFSCELWRVDWIALLIHRMRTPRLRQDISTQATLLSSTRLADVNYSGLLGRTLRKYSSIHSWFYFWVRIDTYFTKWSRKSYF